MKLVHVTSAAEHLKAVVQETLSTFQEGAGVDDGRPSPMTFELAVRKLWHEIDAVLYTKYPRHLERRVELRVVKHDANFAELVDLLVLLDRFGSWAVRSQPRLNEGEKGGGGGNEEPRPLVVYVAGALHDRRALVAFFGSLRGAGWTITDLKIGTL